MPERRWLRASWLAVVAVISPGVERPLGPPAGLYEGLAWRSEVAIRDNRAMVSARPDLGLMTIHNVGLEQMWEDWGYLDGLGISSLWLGDHYAVPRLPELPLWETWTLLATLAGRTSRCTVGTLVTNVAMRNPALLAKQITTLDHLSGGRLVVGLGTGYYEQEHAWVGVPFPPTCDRVTRLGEAVEILDRLLRGERFRLDGEYFKVDHAPSVPAAGATPSSVVRRWGVRSTVAPRGRHPC